MYQDWMKDMPIIISTEKRVIEDIKPNRCEYCKNDGYYHRNKSLISKTLKNEVDIDLSIDVKDKILVASIENLKVNIEDDNWIISKKKINYCPMCGRKLGEEDKQ